MVSVCKTAYGHATTKKRKATTRNGEMTLSGGGVRKVSGNSITVNVTAGGADVGKTLTYAVTPTTRVQVGSQIIGGGISADLRSMLLST